MTTALASNTDVEAALGRTLSTEQTERVDGLLLLASAAVEDATGFRFAPDDYTIGRTVRRGRVTIPASAPEVTEVREVDQCDGSAAVVSTDDWTLRGKTLWCSTGSRYVEVDFTTEAETPNEVVTLVAGIVANTLAMPPVGAASETAGPFSISYVSNSGRVFLAASDKAVLRRYKQPKPALDLLA